MEMNLRILAKLLIDNGAQVTISGGEEVLERLMRERCCQALGEIREVLDDCTLDDPSCFQRIEQIVEIYERLGSNGGSRHDF